MNLIVETFKDVHLHAASMRDWRQTYSQLSPGLVRSSLQHVEGKRFQLFRENINQRLVQQGEAPQDRVCFAFPLLVPGAARLQGREADDRCMLALKGGEEFLFHMPQGMDMLSVTIDRETYLQAVENSPWRDEASQWMSKPVIRMPVHRLAQSRERLLQLLARSMEISPYTDHTQAEQELESDLLEEIICLLADPSFDSSQRLPSSPGCFIVEKCHQMTMTDRQTPPSVLDLCERLRVSRRTVQSSFRAVTQITPVNYIRCIRLNGVRRELLGSRASELTIGDAAGQWGFYHLSHFAADYQILFGELPSQTRRLDRAAMAAGMAERRQAA
ncbi:MAG: helix-turn-helix domain-containing protein [Burkholderiales bacterium]